MQLPLMPNHECSRVSATGLCGRKILGSLSSGSLTPGLTMNDAQSEFQPSSTSPLFRNGSLARSTIPASFLRELQHPPALRSATSTKTGLARPVASLKALKMTLEVYTVRCSVATPIFTMAIGWNPSITSTHTESSTPASFTSSTWGSSLVCSMTKTSSLCNHLWTFGPRRTLLFPRKMRKPVHHR